MPTRFVDVVDVGAEASSTVAWLMANGAGLAGTLSFNITDYLNETTVDSLLNAIAMYNVSADALPTDLGQALRAAGLDVGAPAEYVPEGRARAYMLASLALLLTREVYVRWRVKRLLHGHGMHEH